ncbi:MAG: Type II secretion system protein F [Candidatus Methanoperedenaceae archaeon GB50]|nr:MAG: Type II secretion system protein F [Candidatus Methanoperedenaceae archaeon GB50]CAD7780714.1 Type II secretion system protein F [Candidatus Methanoperedenaceae archaeon GB50]CAD7783752.1 MAG: Type II secretion system protein F [Candidatus Methanoperedenaceae archaeon GB37]
MPVFVWEGKRPDGKVVRGELEASNIGIVKLRLKREDIVPTKIRPKTKGFSDYLVFLQGRVKEKEIVLFIRQFGTMLNAGVPVVRALDVLAAQQSNKLFKKILQDIKTDVEGGSTLADAFSKYPRHFDELFVNMIAAGETGGVIDQALDRLGNYREKALALKRKVKGAMVYPLITLAVALTVLIVILIYVIPAFESIFSAFGAALPAPTQFVINLSNWFRKYMGYIFLVMIGLGIALKLFKRTEKGNFMFDQLLLKIPLIGVLLQKTAIARFSRTLSTMLQSGVPILQSLDIVAKTSGNKVIEKKLLEVKLEVSRGQSLAAPMAQAKIFPPLVVQMTAVGEETGELENMLSKIADFYEAEVDAAVEALTSMLEPMMIVFLGGLIGGLVVALYLPIFKLGAVVGG